MERRRDPLTGQWRTFATHRQDRTFLPAEVQCPLCPSRPGGPPTEVPETFIDVFVFENRFPAFMADPPDPDVAGTALYPVAAATGAAEVVVYTDRHDLTMAELGTERITRIVDVWADRYEELGRRAEIDYVFIFENKGVVVGVTLSHPHGQIYGYPEIPPLARLELDVARAHLDAHGTCVVCDIVASGEGDGARVVARNQGFVAYVPFAARFPYEVHVTARRHAPSLLALTGAERADLAALIDVVARTYDRLFGFSLPYVMALHQSPTCDGDWEPISHLHVEFTPLHRAADKLKYLAGSELAAGAFIGDLAPEHTSAALRDAISK